FKGNDLGYGDSMAGDVINNGEEKDEAVHTTTNTHMGSSETVEVEKERRSSRNVHGSVRYDDHMEESDGDSVEKKDQKRKSSTKEESKSKKVKMGTEVS
ncbi:hypothetical protein PMAYCL1PPCAC_14226, partial [Pristionchus mayeri]